MILDQIPIFMVWIVLFLIQMSQPRFVREYCDVCWSGRVLQMFAGAIIIDEEEVVDEFPFMNSLGKLRASW